MGTHSQQHRIQYIATIALLLCGLASAEVVDPYTEISTQGENTLLTTSPEARFYHNGFNWQSINNQVVAGGELDYQNKANKWKGYFKAHQDVNDPIKVVNQGHWVTLQPTSVAVLYPDGEVDSIGVPNHQAADVSANRLHFEDVYTEGVNVTVTVESGSVRYLLALADKSNLPFPEYPGECTNEPLWHLLLHFRLKKSSGQAIYLDGVLWNEQGQPANLSRIELYDTDTGVRTFTLNPSVAWGKHIQMDGLMSIEKQGQFYTIGHSIPDHPFRYPENYPVFVDPDIQMNDSQADQMRKYTTCTQNGSCCGYFPSGSCDQGEACEMKNPPVDYGITKYAAGTCNACSPFISCCFPNGNAIEFSWIVGFNLSKYITEDWDLVQVNEATYELNVIHTLVGGNIVDWVNHTYKNDTYYRYCNGLQVGIYPNTNCDDPPGQITNTSVYKLFYNHTCVTDWWITHTQYGTDEKLLYFHVQSNGLTSVSNKYNVSYLHVNYTLVPCRDGGPCTINCSKNWTITDDIDANGGLVTFSGIGATILNAYITDLAGGRVRWTNGCDLRSTTGWGLKT